jgi:hypothetical protein
LPLHPDASCPQKSEFSIRKSRSDIFPKLGKTSVKYADENRTQFDTPRLNGSQKFSCSSLF